MRHSACQSLTECHPLACAHASFLACPQSLVSQSGSRIAILAGGGVTASNVSAFVTFTGVREVHASLRAFRWGRSLDSARKAGVYMGGEKSNSGLEVEYGLKGADEDTIRKVTTMLQQQAAPEPQQSSPVAGTEDEVVAFS